MIKDYSFLEILKNKNISKEEIKEFAKKMENAVNSFGFPKKEICEILLNNAISEEHFFDISLIWIVNLSTRKEWEYDGRNEASVKMAKELDSNMRMNDFTLNTLGFEEEAAKWHRTLQQTFSGLVFMFLDKTEYSKNIPEFYESIKNIREKYGEKWYYMPLI